MNSNRCLDADTLAAWIDGTLDAYARAEAETHAADCGRCQALLAAMVRTLPPPVAARPWWRAPVAWVLPATAAAAAAIVWAIVPRPMGRASDPRQSIAESAPASSTVTRSPADNTPQQLADARPVTPPPARTAAPPAPSAMPPTATPSTTTPSASTLATPAPEPAVPDQRLAEQRFERAAAPDAAGKAASPPAQSRFMAAAAPRDAMRSVPGTVIVSPDAAVRWRILPDGSLQGSRDGGVTWERQETGVSVALTAGRAPSASVCWLVGRQGTVLRTIDGRSWTRIAFAEQIDLVSIDAADDRNATVTAADRRVFRTTDGGSTWNQVQERF